MRDSVILNDSIIEPGAVVERCVVDRQVRICQDARVGHSDDNSPNTDLSGRLNTGLTLVGKGSVVPARTRLGRNVVVHPFSRADAYNTCDIVESGTSIGRNLR